MWKLLWIMLPVTVLADMNDCQKENNFDRKNYCMASYSGRRIVEMAWEDLKPSDFLTAKSFDNAIITAQALSGSTNALIHLIAMAGRAGVKLELERFDEIARNTPVLANIRPAGQKYLMEDFYYAGGLRALLNEIRDLLKSR